MTKGPGTGGRPGHGRNNPRPGQRGTKATPAVRGKATGKPSQHGKRPVSPRPGADKCCPMVETVHAVRRGKFKLARRYAALSVRLMMGVA
jgi:hypothetical protein